MNPAARDAGDQRRKPTRLISALKVAVANIAVVVIILSAMEGYFRVTTANDFFFLFSEPRMRLDGRAFVAPHPTRGFVLRAGYSDEQIEIDDRGFRAGNEKDEPSTPEIAVLTLGESTTFGWNVPQGCDYPAVLERDLAERTGRSVEVINGGVPSYSSTQVAITLEELVDEGQRADVVLISIVLNDVYYSATPNWYPELLVHQQPPAWRRLLFRHSATFRHLTRLQIGGLGEIDQANPQALDHFRFNIERLLRVKGPQFGPIVFVEPPYCEERVDPGGMRGLGIQYTTPFLTARVEEYAEQVRRIAARHNAVVIDHPLSILHTPQPELFLDFIHPSVEGNEIMARAVADGLEAAAVVRSR